MTALAKSLLAQSVIAPAAPAFSLDSFCHRTIYRLFRKILQVRANPDEGRVRMYCYLTIRPSSPAYPPADTQHLAAFLQALPDLRQKGPVSFGNASGKPWVDVTIVRTTASGGWASDGAFIPLFDRVVLVDAESPPCFDWYATLAARIAEFLGWEAVEDSDDRLIHPKREYLE